MIFRGFIQIRIQYWILFFLFQKKKKKREAHCYLKSDTDIISWGSRSIISERFWSCLTLVWLKTHKFLRQECFELLPEVLETESRSNIGRPLEHLKGTYDTMNTYSRTIQRRHMHLDLNLQCPNSYPCYDPSIANFLNGSDFPMLLIAVRIISKLSIFFQLSDA